MTKIKTGDIVIIKPGTRYDGRNSFNPNWKEAYGIACDDGARHVEWYILNREDTCTNSYSAGDIILLVEYEDALNYWKEKGIDERIKFEQKKKELYNSINKNKIYLAKGIRVKNLKDLLTKLLICEDHNMASNLRTYYRIKDIEIIQCHKYKYRSFDDILLIAQTYYPKVKVETVFKTLLLLNNEKFKDKKTISEDSLIPITLSFCNTINRIRFINTSSRIRNFTNLLGSTKGKSKYSWKELFKMIDINTTEDYLNFYKTHYEKV